MRAKLLHKRSLFWKYVFMCASVIVVSCLLIGLLIGNAYIRSVNTHRKNLIQNQAAHVISDLDNQLDSMHALALKLSIQSIYQRRFIEDNPYNEMVVASSLEQYASYSGLAKEFALMYRHLDGSTTTFRSSGGTCDIDVFFRLYNLESYDTFIDFLFTQTGSGRILPFPGGFLIAYPLPLNSHLNRSHDSTLCFVVDASALIDRISLSGDLPEGSYSLSYQDIHLISCDSPALTISVGSEAGFSIAAAADTQTISSLLADPNDIVLLILSLLVLVVFILLLAWRCFQPIRLLSNKYSPASSASDVGNELVRLEQAMESMRTRSDLLREKNDDQANQLRNYVLLMLLNNARTQNISEELKKVNIELPFLYFFVITIAASNDQVVTSQSLELLSKNLADIEEDSGVLFSVECSSTSHVLAILCNVESEEQHQTILRRLRQFLNRQPIHFFMGEGSVCDSIAGVSASYLAALSQLRFSINSHNRTESDAAAHKSESSKLVAQIISQIERGCCQEALLNLDSYMKEIEQNQSELTRRYHVMDISFAIRELCTKLEYELSEQQLSILLSMGNVQSIHFALFHLIPALCACASEKNKNGILSTDHIVMDYLNRHYCDYDISVQKIAEAVGIGINRTSAIIKDNTNSSLKTVVTSMRIEQAKRLLKDTSLSIADISTHLGYSSASYFIRVFKISENITPEAYRKQYQA